MGMGSSHGDHERVSSPDVINFHVDDRLILPTVYVAMQSLFGASGTTMMRSTLARTFGSLVTAIKWLITENPAILGVCSQLPGLGTITDHPSAGYSLDVGRITGRVATAASATVSGVVGMMGLAEA